MQYLKSEHFIIDFRKGTKTPAGVFYATKELDKSQKHIKLISPDGSQPNATIKLEGEDLLAFRTFVDGSDQVISAGRFLNDHYEEMIFSSDLPDRGLWVDGVIAQVSPGLFLSTKTVKIKATAEPAAVIQETIHYISKDEFLAATSGKKH